MSSFTITRAPTVASTRANARAHTNARARSSVTVVRALERSKDEDSPSTADALEEVPERVPDVPPAKESTAAPEDIGEAIRAAKEAKADEGANIFAGALEEVGLIEWPSAGKALGTTGLVMGGIFGSAAVLLGVNGLLSELSQRLFP
jgi:preprotein translocase subunit SecE